jgi:hypothetical protein
MVNKLIKLCRLAWEKFHGMMASTHPDGAKPLVGPLFAYGAKRAGMLGELQGNKSLALCDPFP